MASENSKKILWVLWEQKKKLKTMEDDFQLNVLYEPQGNETDDHKLNTIVEQFGIPTKKRTAKGKMGKPVERSSSNFQGAVRKPVGKVILKNMEENQAKDEVRLE